MFHTNRISNHNSNHRERKWGSRERFEKKQKSSRFLILSIIVILVLTGCNRPIGFRNITSDKEIDSFSFPMNNCGNTGKLEITERFTYSNASTESFEFVTGKASFTSSDIAYFQSQVKKARNVSQASDQLLTLTAGANENVLYTLQQIYGWEKGTLYDTKNGQDIAWYKIKTGFFAVAIEKRETKPCP